MKGSSYNYKSDHVTLPLKADRWLLIVLNVLTPNFDPQGPANSGMPSPPAPSLITTLSLAVQPNHTADWRSGYRSRNWGTLKICSRPKVCLASTLSLLHLPPWYYNSRVTKRTSPKTYASLLLSLTVSESLLLKTHSIDLKCYLIFKSPTKVQSLLRWVRERECCESMYFSGCSFIKSFWTVGWSLRKGCRGQKDSSRPKTTKNRPKKNIKVETLHRTWWDVRSIHEVIKIDYRGVGKLYPILILK